MGPDGLERGNAFVVVMWCADAFAVPLQKLRQQGSQATPQTENFVSDLFQSMCSTNMMQRIKHRNFPFFVPEQSWTQKPLPSVHSTDRPTGSVRRPKSQTRSGASTKTWHNDEFYEKIVFFITLDFPFVWRRTAAHFSLPAGSVRQTNHTARLKNKTSNEKNDESQNVESCSCYWTCDKCYIGVSDVIDFSTSIFSSTNEFSRNFSKWPF